MIDANHLLLALIALVLFGQVLAVTVRSKQFWIATDYLWYALAALSVGLFVSDLNDRLKHEDIGLQLTQVERQSDEVVWYFKRKSAQSNCPSFDPSCTQVTNIIENLTEFKASANWPFGDFEDNQEENYSSLPEYLNEIGPELQESFPGSFQELPQMSTMLTMAIADLENLQDRKTWKVSVAIMRIAVYLFVMGVALKIGKVTWTLRQKN